MNRKQKLQLGARERKRERESRYIKTQSTTPFLCTPYKCSTLFVRVDGIYYRDQIEVFSLFSPSVIIFSLPRSARISNFRSKKGNYSSQHILSSPLRSNHSLMCFSSALRFIRAMRDLSLRSESISPQK